MADKQQIDNTIVEVDARDGRGFQPVDAVAEQVTNLAVSSDNADDEEDEEDEDEDLENDLASLPANVQLRLAALRKLQEQQAEVEEQFEKERKQLELKYEKLYQRFYKERAEIVSGAKEVEAVVNGEGRNEGESEEDKNVKGVPSFWLRAFMNHSVLADLIHERDLPAFDYLVDVRSTSHEEDNGFKLEFDFAENPFFANKTLSKEYVISDASEAGEAVLSNVVGTVIEWKEGKSLCEVTKKVKQRAKGSKGSKGETRIVSRTEPCESFFQFFTPVDMPTEEDDEDNDLIMRQLTSDFEIGFLIHETIIPQALLWFTGEAVEDEDSDYSPEDDYDDDEDEEDDSDKDDAPPRARKTKKKLPALDGANSTEKPPECKNQ